jgi:hypothetical protein
MKILKSRVKTNLEPQNHSTEKMTEIKEDCSESFEEENDNPNLDKDRSLIKRKDIDEHPLVITFI